MGVLQFIKDNNAFFSILTSVILAIITLYYAIITHKILKTTRNQQKITLNPVIGIKVMDIMIGPEFGRKRRQLNVNIELTNVGNAPAIETIIDSEIELMYSPIQNEYIIPSRYEPDIIPFMQQGETIGDIYLNYGNTFILHFFDAVREAHRLNIHRIETDPSQKAFKTSRLYINVYYRNSLEQYFYSHFAIEIGIDSIVDSRDEKALDQSHIPASHESKKVSTYLIPRPVFHAGLITKKEIEHRINKNNNKRKLCGW